MSLFGKILEKLGLGGAAQAAPVPQARSASPAQASAQAQAAPSVAPAPSVASAPPPPVALGAVDVVSQLEKLPSSNPEKLNWKVSIVDLLKLLGLDSSFAARKALATELGCPADKMGDSANMNMWLHMTVLL